MKLNRNSIYINLLFLAFILPPIFILSYTYQKYYKRIQTESLVNPYGLYITNYNLSTNSIELNIYNPNNYSVFIYFTELRLQNSFGSSALLTSGLSSNLVFIKPHSSYLLYYYVIDDRQEYISVVAPYIKLGGYINIYLYYSSVNTTVSGIISYTIENNQTNQ